MDEVKTKSTEASVSIILSAIDDQQAREDSIILIKLMKQLTGEPPIMWGPAIIGFGRYHYKYESGREGDICMTGFSPGKGKLSLYVLSGFEGQEELLSKLGKHKTGKVCLYVKRLDDINLDILKEIIVRSMDFLKKKYQ